MTADELLARLSSRELTEWMALATLDAKVTALITDAKMAPEVAHAMVWETDDDALDDGA